MVCKQDRGGTSATAEQQMIAFPPFVLLLCNTLSASGVSAAKVLWQCSKPKGMSSHTSHAYLPVNCSLFVHAILV